MSLQDLVNKDLIDRTCLRSGPQRRGPEDGAQRHRRFATWDSVMLFARAESSRLESTGLRLERVRILLRALVSILKPQVSSLKPLLIAVARRRSTRQACLRKKHGRAMWRTFSAGRVLI